MTPSKQPSLIPGAHYCYPVNHTYVHLIKKTKVWESGHKKGWGFKIKRVPTSLSIGEFMDAIAGSDAKGLVCTEVFELGEGRFSKVRGLRSGDNSGD